MRIPRFSEPYEWFVISGVMLAFGSLMFLLGQRFERKAEPAPAIQLIQVVHDGSAPAAGSMKL